MDKDSLMWVIRQNLPATEAGLLGGILAGDKSGISKEMYQNLTNSGLVHIVVVSGSNVMLLIGGGIEILARFLGRRRAIILGLLTGFNYAAMVGWEIPVVRATLLMSILYFAQALGRKFNLPRAIILAVGMMIIGDVKILTSISFWLSITAFLAVVSAKRFKTLWVSLAITPILAYTFGKISLISPFCNLAVLGLIEFVSVMGAIGAITAMVWGAAGRVILSLTIPGLKYLAILAMGAGQLPTLTVSFNLIMLLGWYGLMVYAVLKWSGNSK